MTYRCWSGAIRRIQRLRTPSSGVVLNLVNGPVRNGIKVADGKFLGHPGGGKPQIVSDEHKSAIFPSSF